MIFGGTMKRNICLSTILALSIGIHACGSSQSVTKSDDSAASAVSVSSASTPSQTPASREITSLAGRWRLQNKNERAIWFFDTSGRCAIRPSGLVEQKGRYQYDGKHLVINFDSGTTRYTVLEKTEPNLVIMMRWGDLYNITNVLTRVQ